MSTFIIKRWAGCGRFQGQLVAYSEGNLAAAKREPIAAHMRHCEACRNEVAALGAMANLLGTHLPVSASPAPDLWERLQTQIAAEPRVTPPARTPSFWPQGLRVALPVAASGLLLTVLVQSGNEARQTNTANTTTMANTTMAAPLAFSAAPVVKPSPVVARVLPTAPFPAPHLSVSADTANVTPKMAFAVVRPHRARRRQPVFVAVVQVKPTRSLPAPAAMPAPATVTPQTLAPPVLIAKTNLDSSVGSAGAAETTQTADTLPVTQSKLPAQTRVAFASSSDINAAAATLDDMAAAREVPASASVSDFAGPLRRQAGLFSYQAR